MVLAAEDLGAADRAVQLGRRLRAGAARRSAGRSAPTRRSSTCSSTPGSAWTSCARSSGGPRGRPTPPRPSCPLAAVGGQGLRRRGLRAGRRDADPGARRHRLHLGARRPPLLAPREGRPVPARATRPSTSTRSRGSSSTGRSAAGRTGQQVHRQAETYDDGVTGAHPAAVRGRRPRGHRDAAPAGAAQRLHGDDGRRARGGRRRSRRRRRGPGRRGDRRRPRLLRRGRPRRRPGHLPRPARRVARPGHDRRRPRDWGGIASLPFAALRKPVIAAVNGPAVGIGATLTLPMDIRIAAGVRPLRVRLRPGRDRAGGGVVVVPAAGRRHQPGDGVGRHRPGLRRGRGAARPAGLAGGAGRRAAADGVRAGRRDRGEHLRRSPSAPPGSCSGRCSAPPRRGTRTGPSRGRWSSWAAGPTRPRAWPRSSRSGAADFPARLGDDAAESRAGRSPRTTFSRRPAGSAPTRRR